MHFTVFTEHPCHVFDRYGTGTSDDLMDARSLRLAGGHCTFFGDSPDLSDLYRQYLYEVGFLVT